MSYKTDFDVRRIYIVVPTPIFNELKEKGLLRTLDSAVVGFLEQYLKEHSDDK